MEQHYLFVHPSYQKLFSIKTNSIDSSLFATTLHSSISSILNSIQLTNQFKLINLSNGIDKTFDISLFNPSILQSGGDNYNDDILNATPPTVQLVNSISPPSSPTTVEITTITPQVSDPSHHTQQQYEQSLNNLKLFILDKSKIHHKSFNLNGEDMSMLLNLYNNYINFAQQLYIPKDKAHDEIVISLTQFINTVNNVPTIDKIDNNVTIDKNNTTNKNDYIYCSIQ